MGHGVRRYGSCKPDMSQGQQIGLSYARRGGSGPGICRNNRSRDFNSGSMSTDALIIVK